MVEKKVELPNIETLVEIGAARDYGSHCDNPIVHINGHIEDTTALSLAVGLVMGLSPGGKAHAVKLSDNEITFYWHEDSSLRGLRLLPIPLTAVGVIHTIREWMKQAKFPQEPDHDGSNGKGWELTSGDFWGHVDGSHYSIFKLSTTWMMYGK